MALKHERLDLWRDYPKYQELREDLDQLLAGRELFSCVLLDLDKFKAVNDRNGHDAGDLCLEAVVQIVGQVVLLRGKLYRFKEGDEFAVVLRNTTTAEATATADRIRTEIEIERPGGNVNVTASIGVISSEQDDIDSSETLLGTVDEAMYVSKFKGGNMVTACPANPQDLAGAREARSKAMGRAG